ncbi:MAG TPA: SpoIIE family protein phosphatase [Terracidiphilus sp.]|nr:SpoIIE family protein phosphatase [Terracidiphilus sp.]
MTAGFQLPGSEETIELQQQVARLQALLEASRQVHSTIHENEVLEQTLRIVVRELEMAGAAFPDVGMAYGNVKELKLGDGGAAMPIYLLQDREGNRMAELVVAPPDGRELSLYEADFLDGLALQAAVALENARNHERNLQWARVQQDLDAARNIQRSLLPQTLPSVAGYSVGFKSVTCYEVGGDYLDIMEQPDGTLLMVVADVAGKGLASAIMSTIFRSAFRAIANASTDLPLDELAAQMNQHHWTEGDEARRRYVTAIFLRLHPEKGELEVVNAGHNPGFLLQPDGKVVQFESTGTPLGLLPGMRYSSQKCAFAKGARLLFYTDGLTEVFRGDEEFGPERLMDVFCGYRSGKADDILGALWTAIGDFSQGSPQGDDMTALALSREAECAMETNA